MPELPDITLYVEKLAEHVVGERLLEVRVTAPFLLRTVEPPLSAARNCRVLDVRRIGKRIAIGLDNDLWLVIHLMVAGRLRWHNDAPRSHARQSLAVFEFSRGSLLLTEAGTRKRASLHVVSGQSGLDSQDPGGLQPLECSFPEFCEMLARESHTLKRALTSPRLFSGIGNAYSDEILHAARLSPTALSGRLTVEQKHRLFDAMRSVLSQWLDRLRHESAGRFPAKVTAFRDGMAVHGRYGKACPECGATVQRIRYKDHETNYCAVCQTGGRLLADRSLSRLLKDDWPRTYEE